MENLEADRRDLKPKTRYRSIIEYITDVYGKRNPVMFHKVTGDQFRGKYRCADVNMFTVTFCRDPSRINAAPLINQSNITGNNQSM